MLILKHLKNQGKMWKIPCQRENGRKSHWKLDFCSPKNLRNDEKLWKQNYLRTGFSKII